MAATVSGNSPSAMLKAAGIGAAVVDGVGEEVEREEAVADAGPLDGGDAAVAGTPEAGVGETVLHGRGGVLERLWVKDGDGRRVLFADVSVYTR